MGIGHNIFEGRGLFFSLLQLDSIILILWMKKNVIIINSINTLRNKNSKRLNNLFKFIKPKRGHRHTNVGPFDPNAVSTTQFCPQSRKK